MEIVKSAWGPGAWQDEPDRVEWRHRSGLRCLIVRSTATGGLCGYVGLSHRHPLYGAQYHELGLDVHGDLTYGNLCQGKICHEPGPGEPRHVYWLGFDCGHAWDYSPALMAWVASRPAFFRANTEYRNLRYVRAEVERLADQVAALTGPVPLRIRRLRARAARRHEQAAKHAEAVRVGWHRRRWAEGQKALAKALYFVLCDRAVRYIVVADSPDECKALINEYEKLNTIAPARRAFVDFSIWDFTEAGRASGPARVVTFDVVSDPEPTTKG